MDAVTCIYKKLHALEEAGLISIGWDSNIYPIRKTAENALDDDTLFVMTIDDKVVASAIINQEQPPAYSLVEWSFHAHDDKVGVLHTLVVDPDFGKRGLGNYSYHFLKNIARRMDMRWQDLIRKLKTLAPSICI